jgi:hypothetical protein
MGNASANAVPRGKAHGKTDRQKNKNKFCEVCIHPHITIRCHVGSRRIAAAYQRTFFMSSFVEKYSKRVRDLNMEIPNLTGRRAHNIG